MRDLLHVELTRLRWRRAVLLLAVAAVVIPGIVLAATVYNTRPVSASDLQQGQELVDQEVQQPYIQRDLKRCLKKPRQYGAAPGEDARAACERAVYPRVEWFVGRPRLDLVEQREAGTGLAVAVILTMFLLLMGTTFAGHDWNSGSMSNQLLFEARRERVWLAKGAVVLATGFALSLLVLVGYWTGLWSVATARDVPIPDHAVSAAYKQAVLGAILASGAGLAGYALTMLFRSTVATLGILFAVAFAGSAIVAALGFTGATRYLPATNYAAFMIGGYTATDYDRAGCDGGFEGDVADECVVRISRADSTAYFGGLLLVSGLVSLTSFRRRDVP